MKRITFSVNPVSGGKDKKDVLAAIGRYLDLSCFSFEVLQTARAGDATEWARTSMSDIVVAVGGDGTVSEVAAGLLGTEKALGIIPCGSGDGLALHLGISRSPAKAVRILNEACVTRIDAARMDDRPFFCTAGVGLDADVSLEFSRSSTRGLGTYVSMAWEKWKFRIPEFLRRVKVVSRAVRVNIPALGLGHLEGNDLRRPGHHAVCSEYCQAEA